MRITLIFFAALAVTQGSMGSLPGHSDNSLLYSLLQSAGFSDSCVSGVLDMCSSAQEEAHFPSLIQNIQEVKLELQKVQEDAQEGKETMQQNMQQVIVELQKVQEEVQEGKEAVQQKIQAVKVELQKVQEEALEGKETVQQEIQAVKVEVQEVKEMLHQVMLTLLKNESLPRHCKELLDSGDSRSGLREVFPDPERPQHGLIVFCDQDTDGGGWTVFQRRVNKTNRVDFYRIFAEYQAGFGDLEGEFWLGLDNLYELTKTKQELRVDLQDYEGEHRWAKYGTFQVGSVDTNYRLTIGSFSGDAGDSMTEYHNGRGFSTHDKGPSSSCARGGRGAWWYGHCGPANLNGYQYVGDNSPTYQGITWYPWRGGKYSMMRTTMMLRPAL